MRRLTPTKFYVDIGTSDFGTLHHQFYENPDWEGVAVEPLKELLSALPSRPGLFKENAAFGCSKGETELTLYALSRGAVAKLGLPHWALGTACPSLDDARKNFAHRHPGWIDALATHKAPCMSWSSLVAKYGLADRRVDILKTDAEGLDFAILDEILDWYHDTFPLLKERSPQQCNQDDRCVDSSSSSSSSITAGHSGENRGMWPAYIVFEAWELEGPRYEAIMEKMAKAGYQCRREGVNDVHCKLSL